MNASPGSQVSPGPISTDEGRRVAWRHVLGFVAIAYGLAWLVWAPALGDAWDAITEGETPPSYTAPGLAVLGMFAPAIAAVVMRLWVSKEGLRGSLGPVRTELRWYLLAVLVPALLVPATVAIATATGAADFHLGVSDSFVTVWLALMLVNTPLTAVLTFGEEYGWRGYLLPKLLPLGELKASALIALIWAPWHLPLLMVGLNYVDKNPAAVMAFMFVFVLGMSTLLTRLFVASGGSVLVVTLAHASLNAFGDRLSDAKHLVGDAFVASVGGLVGFALLALIVLAAYSRRDRRSRQSPKGGALAPASPEHRAAATAH